ncbi:MAG: aminoglycoside phosphotransferase family protein [Lachnospiraceae bacterium]|nr:aminoglycoside phosphotransferase family protein [Lachnospiraceae bacterium]
MEFKDKYIIAKRSNKTVYRIGNEVIKLSVPEHPKAGVFNEALITACVESYGVPVAKVLYVKEFDGQWGLGLEYVEGENLADKIKNEPENLDANLEKFVSIQLDVNKFKAVGLRNTIEKRTEEINALKGIDPSTRFELLQRLAGMKRHTKLCHGDFDPSNIILTADGGYKVLDWAHATQGNAGADAALTYLQFTIQDPELADKYLRIYSKAADMPIQYIQKWMPIVAAGQLTKAKSDEETALLEKWISVAEYQ